MEPTIVVLAAELASQIAAGEVVERPASVVKELIENALDAGATRVSVAIEAGGVGLIEVADDGSGMSPLDAQLCLQRHATSKLRRFTDLDELRSYGFRGEALPSIASVARLTLRTRTSESDAATELFAAPGEELSQRPAAAPVGTTVRVADLFFNVPARRKFLRSTGTEAGHVGDVVLDAALCRPDVSFTLSRDGRQVRNWPRTATRAERIRQVLGDEELLECHGERGPLTVFALLSRPERARQGAAGLKVLVNGRPIRDRALAGTVAHAYGSVLERGRYPRGVVYLELPQRLVDVNVHPQKTEVRFADPRAVTDAVHSVVSRQLAERLAEAPRHQASTASRSEARTSAPLRPEPPPPSPTTAPDLWQHRAAAPPEPLRVHDITTESEATGHALDGTRSPTLVSHPASVATPSRKPSFEGTTGQDRHSQTRWAKLRFLTQVRETYLLCEGQEGLYVLDQHAAAERVVFSKLRRQYQARSVAAQALLFPLTVEVTPQESETLALHAEQVAAVGLDVRVRTPEAVSIHAVPRLLQRASPERMLRDLMAEVSRSGERAFSDAIDKALATMACHAAVRAGDPVSQSEAAALLGALDEADFAAYCPHGRPIVTFTSWEELERKVGRR